MCLLPIGLIMDDATLQIAIFLLATAALGAVIGWLGVFIGVLAGVLLALNVPTVVPMLEQVFGFQIMPGDVYYVTRIPSILEAEDVFIIAIGAFLLTSLATLYPARRAALVNPAMALRYE